MTPHALAWTLFGAVLAVTFFLAWLGHRRTKTFADFAVGGRSMGPLLAGTTLGACLASTATFVINPGFVYAYGLPALVALTLPLFAGVLAGLLILGPGFRRFGATATTLPAWIGERYGSQGLRLLFAGLSLLHVFYVVLIVVGAAYVMQATMGVSYGTAVSIVTGVVFSYVLLGGTYAHAYTNTAQGAVMLVVAVLIGGAAAREILGAGGGSLGGALDALAAQDVHLVGLVHPESPFYRHWAEVLVCPFVIGFALVAQPHLLVKTLYLRDAKDMVAFGATGFACFVVFSLVLLGGLAARLGDGGALAQDVAMSAWLTQAFPPALGAVVSVAILAAAMSTLDGLLVAVSAIVGGDLVAQESVAARLGARSPEARGRLALNAGRITVLALGGVAWLVAQQPPELVGIFGTVGAYGLLVASLPAVLLGIACEQPPAPRWIALGAVLGLLVHGGLYVGGVTINTGLTATAGLAISLPLPLIAQALTRTRAKTEITPAATPARAGSQRLELVGA
jgi:SSS family solute:Na+ symporter/sodium/pantothenate symporter